jgi:hypothetical protein
MFGTQRLRRNGKAAAIEIPKLNAEYKAEEKKRIGEWMASNHRLPRHDWSLCRA